MPAALTTIKISHNMVVPELRLANSPNVELVEAEDCPLLELVDCPGPPFGVGSLTSPNLKLAGSDAITYIGIDFQSFTEFDLSVWPGLVEFHGSNNLFTELDPTTNAALEVLNCGEYED